jgi:hypothetical protein
MEDPTFADTRESTFLKQAIEAIKAKDVNNYRTAVSVLKNVSTLDKWKINMFTKILKNLEQGGEDEAYL